jgi:hypothetical protein
VDGQWDTVYHEHLRFYDPHSFNALLEAYGFGCREWQRIPTHGGSFRMLASAACMWTRHGIGATARATTVINYCGLDVEDIECVCEVPGSDKIGRYIPGTRIPVVSEAR